MGRCLLMHTSLQVKTAVDIVLDDGTHKFGGTNGVSRRELDFDDVRHTDSPDGKPTPHPRNCRISRFPPGTRTIGADKGTNIVAKKNTEPSTCSAKFTVVRKVLPIDDARNNFIGPKNLDLSFNV